MLPDGNVALATHRRGLAIIDSSGNLLQTVERSGGCAITPSILCIAMRRAGYVAGIGDGHTVERLAYSLSTRKTGTEGHTPSRGTHGRLLPPREWAFCAGIRRRCTRPFSPDSRHREHRLCSVFNRRTAAGGGHLGIRIRDDAHPNRQRYRRTKSSNRKHHPGRNRTPHASRVGVLESAAGNSPGRIAGRERGLHTRHCGG